MKKLLQNFKRKDKKSKRGSSVLEFAFGLLTFVMLAAFVVDVVIIATKQFTVSQVSNELSRQIAIQGGVRQSAPAGFPGGQKAYVTSREMHAYIDEALRDTGISSSDWSMQMTGFSPDGYSVQRVSLSDGSNFEVDYRNSFDFTIKYEYNWTIMGQLVPTMNSMREVHQKRGSVSEYKYKHL